MRTPVAREKVRFVSGETECVAWHYRGRTSACIVMAGGMAVTKEPGTDRYAERFAAAGFTVLAFDYRRFGESGGTPRQVMRISDELADWDAALERAAGLPGVDQHRLAVWGFSVSGGHVLPVAARHPELAAVVAQTPTVDGPAAARNAARHQTVPALLRLGGRAIRDTVGGLVGRPPLLVPLSGEAGTVAVLTTPDALDGDRALGPQREHADWPRAVAARSVLSVGRYRPGRYAARVRCPLLVVVCDQDQSALAAPAITAAHRAPRGELLRLAGGHYEPFLGSFDRTVDAELAFLRRHLLDDSSSARPAVPRQTTTSGPA